MSRKIEKLAACIQRLTMGEKQELLVSLGLDEVVWTSLGNVLIYDTGPDEARPRAVIRYADNTESSIDILMSVRRNATSIGHPAILLAIHRWTQIVHHLKHVPAQLETFLKERNPEDQPVPPRKMVRIAENHLRNVGEALIAGARRNALRKESVLHLIERGFGQQKLTEAYLAETWALLTCGASESQAELC